MVFQIIGFMGVLAFGLYLFCGGLFGMVMANAFGERGVNVPMLVMMIIGACVIWWDYVNAPFNIVVK